MSCHKDNLIHVLIFSLYTRIYGPFISNQDRFAFIFKINIAMVIQFGIIASIYKQLLNFCNELIYYS